MLCVRLAHLLHTHYSLFLSLSLSFSPSLSLSLLSFSISFFFPLSFSHTHPLTCEPMRRQPPDIRPIASLILAARVSCWRQTFCFVRMCEIVSTYVYLLAPIILLCEYMTVCVVCVFVCVYVVFICKCVFVLLCL